MWRVDVTPGARQTIHGLDGGLREELMEQVAAMAEEPAAHPHRAMSRTDAGLWVFEYDSMVSPGLRVERLLNWWDPKDKRLGMVRVRMEMESP